MLFLFIHHILLELIGEMICLITFQEQVYAQAFVQFR
jgi:hypothetical protein